MAVMDGFNAAADTIKGFLAGAQHGKPDRPTTTDNVALLSELDDRFKKAKEDRRQYEREWQVNLAFLKGNQWVEWDKVRQTLYLPPAPPWRVRLTTNLIQPIFRTIFGKITKEVSAIRVSPANETPEAEEDARAQDELLEYLRIKCNSVNRSEETLKWAIVCGTGLEHPCWDKSLGDELPPTVDPATGQQTPQVDDSGNPVHLGEIDHISVSPFEFYPEPLAETTEDMEWCFYVKVRPSSYVNRKYGTDLEDETIPSDEYAMNTLDDQRGGSGGNQTKGRVLFEYWERPNPTHPKGRYVAYVKDKILFNGPEGNPYPKVPIPFFEVKEATVPGRFWGRSIVSDLIPVQQAFNKTHSMMLEVQNSTARPKWAVAKGALDPGKTISTAPAEVIVFNPVPGAPDNGRPFKIVGGDIPTGMFQLLERFQAEFYEIAGIHDFSRGLSGLGGVRAGFALQMLLEEDATRTGILKRQFDAANIKTDQAKLRLAKQFYIEPRTIAIVGADSSTEVKQFYGEKIPDDVQVRLVAAGALPTSMAAKQQLVLELWGQKLLADPQVALKLMGMGDVEGVYDDITRDTRQAQRENEVMRTGQPVEAHDYDNHLLHGKEHDADRKSEQYEQIVAQNPQIALVYAQHVESHKALIAAAMQQAQQPPVESPIKSLNVTQPPVVQTIQSGKPLDIRGQTIAPQTPQEAGATRLLKLG